MSATKVTVEATIAADRNKVWDYYTNPKHITKWNFASDDWHCPTAENDMKVGGKYSSRMEAKDGSWGFDFEAVYDEVLDNERFIYTIADGRKVSVDFQSLGNKTKVIVVFEAENQNPVEFQKGGWQAILDSFKKYTENN
jgi:uncharacterized protein YndB with AHSA1/START domain